MLCKPSKKQNRLTGIKTPSHQTSETLKKKDGIERGYRTEQNNEMVIIIVRDICIGRGEYVEAEKEGEKKRGRKV